VIDFSIRIDVSSLVPADMRMDPRDLPNLQAAIREVAQMGVQRWRAYASGAALPSGRHVAERHHEKYSESIKVRQVGDFEAELWTDYEKAEAIEHGEPAVDLKKALYTSRKVRRFKDGRRFLIIPFNWTKPRGGAPVGLAGADRNVLPHDVVHWWQGKRAVDHTRRRGSRWQDRISTFDIEEMGGDPWSRGKDRNMVGMHMFRGGRGGGGRFAGASFKTFRTMAEGQSGWIIPRRPALEVAATVADQMRTEAQETFRIAAAQDVARALAAAGPHASGGKATGFRPRWGR
jgi:hypothetical protein